MSLPLALRAWRPRWRLAALGAVAAVAWRLTVPSPPRSSEGLAVMLGEGVAGNVRNGEFLWEAPRSVVSEATVGRRVLFLAASEPGGPRDLYRAQVRLSPEGHPIAVRAVHNLTTSPLGDEQALIADGPYAARFVALTTSAFGSISAATLLDLQGDGGIEGARSSLDALLGALTNELETGSMEGIGRTSFSIGETTSALELRFGQDKLALGLPGEDPLIYALTAQRIEPHDSDSTWLTADRLPHLRKAPVLWAVDTTRSIVGPEPIALLEDHFFALRDTLRRTHYGLIESNTSIALTSTDNAAFLPSALPLDVASAGDDGGYWPPAKLPSIWQSPELDEGVWQAVPHAFLPRPPNASERPPYFLTTYLKPDPQRPYARVLVVAMDMRQLELNIEGGVEDPKPLTGSKSYGRIPREPAILNRVVGAFNGAFKTTHGAYGMMANHKVLLPPQPAAATVVITDDMRVGLGTWPEEERDLHGLLSFRQNLDPLVGDGKLNPTNRKQWGFQLPGTSVLTERSGLCVTRPGHLLYFWGDDTSALSLARAMVQAGCEYGMHLDMNPTHTGFVFAGIRDVKKKDYDVRLLSPQMQILPERYIEWSPKDFFYLMLRDPDGLQKPPGALAMTWAPDGGTQPAPSWLTSIHRAESSDESTNVRLLGIDAGRVRYRLRAGHLDTPGDQKLCSLTDDERRHVLMATGLGNRVQPAGLTVAGTPLGPPSATPDAHGFLVIDEEGDLQIEPGAPRTMSERGDLIELPLMLDGGKLTAAALLEEAQPRPRAAICKLPSGRVVLAQSDANNDAPAASVLAKLGCMTALSLDRGDHQPAWQQRAGDASASAPHADQAVLYAVATTMKPRAFAWKP